MARTGLAEVLKARGDLEAAEAAYRETVQRFPDSVVARNGLAAVLKDRGKLDEAEVRFLEVLETHPTNPYAKTGLTGVFKTRGVEDPEGKMAALIAELPGDREEPSPEPIATTTVGPVEPIAETAVAEAASHPPAKKNGPTLSRRDITILANDAFLVRGWMRATGQRLGLLPEGMGRQRARGLLDRLLPVTESDPLAAGEGGLLELEQGDAEQALELLRRAVRRFPGSARVRCALAQAERQVQSPHAGQAWQRLLRLDARYQPAVWLGLGRGLLSHGDGNTSGDEERARDTLGRLAFWIRERIETVPGCSEDNPWACFRRPEHGGFWDWWAMQAQVYLFGDEPVHGYDDLSSLEPIRDREQVNGPILDRLEEELVLHHARA